MSKKVFTGEKQNLLQLVKDVEQWLRQEGFEVQSGNDQILDALPADPGDRQRGVGVKVGGGDRTFLIQARKKSTWRSLLGTNQTIDVKIVGTPAKYTIDLDAGEWGKNLMDSGAAGFVAAVATVHSLGMSAAWSASERSKIENGLWALKSASCPSCFRIGAAKVTGEKFVRAEGITLQSSGVYQGTKIFTDTFKCKLCSHDWNRGEKPRQATLCPKCYDEKALVSTGKKLITTKKTDKRSQQGQPVGEQVYTNTFRCNACSHTWDDGEHSQLVEVCPGCLKCGTREATGEHIFSVKKTDQRSQNAQFLGEQVVTNTFKCKACSQEWNDGQKTRLVEICSHCEKPGGIESLGQQAAASPEKYTENYRCKFCTKEWNTGEKTREQAPAPQQPQPAAPQQESVGWSILKGAAGVAAAAAYFALAPTEKTCSYCGRTIPATAIRCPYCTSHLY